MQIPYWIWGGSCKFRTDLGGGGRMNSARAWPPFSGPPPNTFQMNTPLSCHDNIYIVTFIVGYSIKQFYKSFKTIL